MSAAWPLDSGHAVALVLHLLRMLPVATLSPFLGGPAVPPPVRLAVASGLAWTAFQAAGASPIDASGLELAGLAARELALGAALAFLATVPVEAARAAGRLVDTARGATLSELHVAPIRQQESAVGSLLVQQVVVLAAVTGGVRLVLEGLLGSFAVLRPGAPFAPSLLTEATLGGTAQLLAASAAVAAPAVAGVAAADLAVAAASRLAPGLAWTDLAQPARAALGLAVVAVAASAAAGRLVALLALPGAFASRLAGGSP